MVSMSKSVKGQWYLLDVAAYNAWYAALFSPSESGFLPEDTLVRAEWNDTAEDGTPAVCAEGVFNTDFERPFISNAVIPLRFLTPTESPVKG